MPYTNFPNGITSMGVPLPIAPLLGPTQGKYIFVKPYSGVNGNDGLTPATAVKTLAYALSLATANQNDVVFLLAESNTAASTTDYQSSNLDWNKDGVHLIGVNNGTMIGQRSRIAPLSTATAFANLFTVSANNCLIANIEFFQGAMATNPSAASTCVTVSGQRNRLVNCQISGIGEIKSAAFSGSVPSSFIPGTFSVTFPAILPGLSSAPVPPATPFPLPVRAPNNAVASCIAPFT